MADSSITRLDAADAIAEMDKAMGALRYELPESVWHDVDGRYRRVRSLAAAERPAVERLVAALEHASMVMRAARISTASKAPNTSELLLEEAEGIDDLVAEFGQQPTGDEQ